MTTRLARLVMGVGLALLSSAFLLRSHAAPAPPGNPPAGAPAASAPQGFRGFHFHRDQVLGTSMDLTVVAATPVQAERCEAAVLAELDRLSDLVSTYDPRTAIRRLTVSAGPVPAAPELLDLLEAYDQWHARSHGALNGALGDLISLWKASERAGKLPDSARLAEVVRQLSTPAWRVDRPAGTVTRLNDVALNVDALGKGYSIDHALAAARAKVPEALGLMLVIGGDLHVTGQAPPPPPPPPPVGANAVPAGAAPGVWAIGVADPRHREDNAPPLVTIALREQAVCTSGPYMRYYVIGGKRYSHIMDPRTGRPAEGVVGATVVAGDCVTANALSTSLCVLPPAEGLALVQATPGTQCLILTADGQRFASPGWAALETSPRAAAAPTTAPAAPAGAAGAAGGWPKDYVVTVDFAIAAQARRKPHRPYIAIWIEDAQGKPLRTVTVWGNEGKYLKELTNWWRFAKGDNTLIQAVTRASRAPGKYQVVWDGLDDHSKPVPPGAYTVRLESARENGTHVNMGASLDCRAAPAKATVAGNKEIEEATVTYGARTP